MIPGDLLSAFPHRQFHTLPGLLDSWAALPNSYPNALRAMQGGSLYHFYDGLWYDPGGRRTHDLPCERRTRYRLSQPDTVLCICTSMHTHFMCLIILSKSNITNLFNLCFRYFRTKFFTECCMQNRATGKTWNQTPCYRYKIKFHLYLNCRFDCL